MGTLPGPTAPLVRLASFIGDTGDDDVSHDADCRCDTHIEFLELAPFILHYTDGGRAEFPGARINGRYFLCPNIPGGHHVRGDRKFDNNVIVTFAMTIRVSDDDMNLLTDVRYEVIEN